MKKSLLETTIKSSEKSVDLEKLASISNKLDEVIALSDGNPEEISEQLYMRANSLKNEVCTLKACPNSYLSDISFFPKLVYVIEKETVESDVKHMLLISINYAISVIDGAFEKCLATPNVLNVVITSFDTANTRFFNSACTFFLICMKNNYIQLLMEINFLDNFFPKFFMLIDLVSEYELDDELNRAIETASKVFLQIVKTFNKDFLEDKREEMHALIVKMYTCPIFYLIAGYSSSIVLELGRKFGFLDMIETEMFSKTMEILSDDRCLFAFKPAIEVIIETVKEDKEDKLSIEMFPIDAIMEISASFSPSDEDRVINYTIRNNDLIETIFRIDILLARAGGETCERIVNDNAFNSIVDTIPRTTTIRLLGQEFLWTIFKNVEKEIALQLTENTDVCNILIDSITDDNDEFIIMAIDTLIGPFVDDIIKGGPFEYKRFASFLDLIREQLEPLLDSENTKIAELTSKLYELLNSIPA